MTKILSELVTDKTDCLHFSKESYMAPNKQQALGFSFEKSSDYLQMMYYYHSNWNYFKEDINNYGYPFYIMDELIGSYLAQKRGIPTVTYQVAKANDSYGISSVHFKTPEFDYCMLQNLPIGSTFSGAKYEIELLQTLCVDSFNAEQLQQHLLEVVALDLYMLQVDRCTYNLQFQKHKTTGYFDIAPLYDYSNCLSSIGMTGLDISHVIMHMDYLNMCYLGRKYPFFQDCLQFWLVQKMSDIFKQICADFHFNQDCRTYQTVLDYYCLKEESQKTFMNQILKDVQK